MTLVIIQIFGPSAVFLWTFSDNAGLHVCWMLNYFCCMLNLVDVVNRRPMLHCRAPCCVQHSWLYWVGLVLLSQRYCGACGFPYSFSTIRRGHPLVPLAGFSLCIGFALTFDKHMWFPCVAAASQPGSSRVYGGFD